MAKTTEQRRAPRPFRLTDRLLSFRYAFRGILLMIRTQHNAWIHAVTTLAVIGLGCWLRISISDWCWLILAMVAVWTAESLNTAFELLADVASPEFHPLVEQSKDVAAGAVLICALGATVIGALVFLPHIIQ